MKCYLPKTDLFENPPNTEVTFTLLATDDYQTWTLFHQCAAITKDDGSVTYADLALVVVKEGAFENSKTGTDALDAAIKKVCI